VVPSTLPITRPIRLAVVGLGQISELMLPAYAANDDVVIVGLCDRNPARLERWAGAFPEAVSSTDLDTVLATSPDVVDVLVPTPLHAEVVVPILERGFHVQVQKPISRELEGADRMVDAARRAGATLNVLEDYRCYPPMVTLGRLVRDGEIGEPVGCHMKIVATGLGGWDVLPESYEWQFQQALDGRGMLVFDHGWHQLALSMWLFGPVRRVYAWIGRTEVVPDVIVMDAPTTLVWEHENGVRTVVDITFAVDMYFQSSHYGGDERVEVTGSKGFVRCNRISAYGVQEPSVVLYRDGEVRAFHALDDRPPDAFAAMADRSVAFYQGRDPEPLLDGAAARDVLAVLLAALESHRLGRAVDL
jgi:UDP-N-acetyl-2-amino-2-deoxyglucuronate dehydrogenase